MASFWVAFSFCDDILQQTLECPYNMLSCSVCNFLQSDVMPKDNSELNIYPSSVMQPSVLFPKLSLYLK